MMAIVLVLLPLFVVETPEHLIAENKLADARHSVTVYYGCPEERAEKIVGELREEHVRHMKEDMGIWQVRPFPKKKKSQKVLSNRDSRRGALVGCTTAFTDTFSGISGSKGF